MIVFSNEKARKSSPPPGVISGITRVDSLKILGVTFDDCLRVHTHVNNVCQTASQALYAIKLLRTYGLDQTSIFSVCHATVMSRLLYAAPSWWGFSSAADREQLQAIINRAIRWGYYKKTDPSLNKACSIRERNLFLSVLQNPSHVLHHLLPPVKPHHYNLRSRPHNRILPAKSHPLMEKNFLSRMLYLPSLIPS